MVSSFEEKAETEGESEARLVLEQHSRGGGGRVREG
jgi:hypothetical protein